MANKMISELESGQITSPGDMFMIQTAGGDTRKLYYAALADRLFSNDIRTGNNNIRITKTSDASGVHLYIASEDTKYTAGAGIALVSGAFSVKLGENLSLNAETGNIDASGGGSVWYFGGTRPASASGGDYWLRNDSGHYGEIESFDGTDWTTVGTFAGQAGADGSDGYSISASVTPVTGGHRITIASTDPNASDISFDVMDGVTTIQTTSANSTATLTAAGWTGASAPYTQTVSVSGMTASIIPIIGLSVSSTASTGVEQQKQWGYVTKAESGAGTITFSCYETKPTVDLTVNIKAV